MQFNKICIQIQHSIMNAGNIICFEHEVPIHQAIHGKLKVTQVDDPLHREGPVVEDNSLDAEWDRLMHHPRIIQTSETQGTPAPLVAYPRGVLDLDDFYARLNKQPENVTPIKPQTKTAAIKEELDALGIEYRGNASTESLKELLASVENDSGSAGLQDQG